VLSLNGPHSPVSTALVGWIAVGEPGPGPLSYRDGVALAGFPHDQPQNYLRKLLQAEHRVAVCEQVAWESEQVLRTGTF
jgi:hypothetical protein